MTTSVLTELRLAMRGPRIVLPAAAVILALAACALPVAAQTNGAYDDSATVYQLKERRVTIGRNGLKTIRIHEIVRILERSAIEYAGDISIAFNSYHEKAELVRAFTRTPDGRTVAVDKKAVHDLMPGDFEDYKMYSDARTLSFSMPALQVGAVLDYEVEVRQTRPVMPGHAWDEQYMDEAVPVEESRYIVQYPASMQLRICAVNITNQPSSRVSGGTTVKEWRLENLPRIEYEAGMPAYHNVRASVHVSSVQSWEDIRRWYCGLAAGRADTSPEMEALVRSLTEQALTLDEKIRALFLYVQKEVRYVGIELGRSAYQPHLASECLRNRYGDCKDQSTLMVAMLKLIGVDASLALLRPNSEGDLVSDCPGAGQFGHAVVHVPLKDGTLWLDPTARYYDERSYPEQLDGVEALVAGTQSNAFVRIPPLPAERNTARSVYEIALEHDGVARVKETTEYVGRSGAEERLAFESVKEKDRREDLEDDVEGRGGRSRLVSFGNSDPHDLGSPFRRWVEYDTDGFFSESADGFTLALSADTVAWPLKLSDDDEDQGGAKSRRYDWVRLTPIAEEIVCRVSLPPGMSVTDKPAPFETEFPHGKVRVAVGGEGRTAEAVASVTALPARIPAAEWRRVRSSVDRTLPHASRTLVITDKARRLLSDMKPREAMGMVEQWLRDAPADADLRHRLGRLYHRCGRSAHARSLYREAIRSRPEKLSVYEDLARTYAGYAGDYGHGMDREAIAAVFRDAADKAADKRSARLCLAELYERNDKGERLADGAPFAKALAVYDGLLAEKEDDVAILLAKGECLFALRNYAEADKVFSRAFELDKTNVEARAGRWACAAFLGRVDDAIDAIRSYYNLNTDRSEELFRVGQLLMRRREYALAADLIEQAILLAKDSADKRALPNTLRRLAEAPRRDYAKWIDLGSPRLSVLSCLAAIYVGDKERLARCYSPRTAFTDQDLELAIAVFGASAGKALDESLRDFALDLLTTEWEIAERKLPGGDVEIKMSPPKKFVLSPAGRVAILFHLAPSGDKWLIYSMGSEGPNPLFIARVAASFIEEGNIDRAAECIRLLGSESLAAARYGSRSPLEELQEQNFPDATTRVLALTGAALMGSEDALMGVGYLKRAREKMADNRTLDRILGGALMATEDYEAAVGILSKLTEGNPGDRMSALALAEALVRVEKFDEAAKILAKLLESSEPDLPARRLRVTLLTEQGEYEKARVELETFRSRLPSPVADAMDAQLLGFMGRTNAIRRIAADATAADPSMRESLYGAFMAAGDAGSAVEQLECILLGSPGNVQVMLTLCGDVAIEGDMEEAASLLARAKSAPVHLVTTREQIATRDQMLGRYADAIEGYRKIKSLPDRSHLVYTRLFEGICCLMTGRREDAAKAFSAAGELHPTQQWPRPLIRHLAGDLPFEELLAIAGRSSAPHTKGNRLCEAYYYAGMCSLAEGKRDEAAVLLRKSVETDSRVTTEYGLAAVELARLSKQAGGEK